MNKELLLIIQSLVNLIYLYHKNMLCKEIRGKAPKLHCIGVECANCYYSLSSPVEKRYGLKIETAIKQF